MANRLGSGEYERVDVEIKQSTIEARYKLLQILKQKRSFWAIDLLCLFNRDTVPKEFLDIDKIDYTIHFFLAYLLNKNPPNLEIISEIIDTPLIDYYRFFFGKEKEIRRLESDTNTQQFAEFHDSIKRRNDALKKIIPNWKGLKIRKDAEALCTSLQRWATKYNLNEDWFLDFALGILRIFKSEFDFKLPNFVWTNTRPNEERSHRINYEWEIIDSIPKAISDYWNDEVRRNKWLGFDDLGEFPAFEYRTQKAFT